MTDPKIFSPGLPVMIEAPGMINPKMSSFIRGLRANKYLILDHPIQDGKLAELHEFNECIVRFIFEGEVIGFRTGVAGIIRKPYPLIFLMYPKTVETSRLRSSARYPVQVEVICSERRLDGRVDDELRQIMLNISAGGCLVESNRSFDRNTTLYVTAFLPESGQVDDVEMEVKRVTKQGSKFLLGLEFADMLDPGFDAIRTFLNQLEIFQVRA